MKGEKHPFPADLLHAEDLLTELKKDDEDEDVKCKEILGILLRRFQVKVEAILQDLYLDVFLVVLQRNLSAQPTQLHATNSLNLLLVCWTSLPFVLIGQL